MSEKQLDPRKYVTFKRETFERAMVGSAWNVIEIQDAVVILKRDVFAGPALHTYAACIAMVAKGIKEHQPEKAAELMKIADYFEDQAREADEDDFSGLPSI